MRHGDFTKLAKYYHNRPGYSLKILELLGEYIKKNTGKEKLVIADVGAGTGKLTENLIRCGFTGYAIEPNDAMRNEGIDFCSHSNAFTWMKGSAEQTGLPDNSVDWILMGSSFHWTDYQKSLKEFNRILIPKGGFTAIYNPRNISQSSLHSEIEKSILGIVPELNRISSGLKQNIEEKISDTSYFSDLIFVEGSHVEEMSKERYLGIWHSVNDIRVQAGEKRFTEILKMIERKIWNLETIVVPYKIRSWTVLSTKTN